MVKQWLEQHSALVRHQCFGVSPMLNAAPAIASAAGACKGHRACDAQPVVAVVVTAILPGRKTAPIGPSRPGTLSPGRAKRTRIRAKKHHHPRDKTAYLQLTLPSSQVANHRSIADPRVSP